MLDVITTFVVGGTILGMLSCYIWTAVLLPIGIIAGSTLVMIVVADKVFVGRCAAVSYRASRKGSDND